MNGDRSRTLAPSEGNGRSDDQAAGHARDAETIEPEEEFLFDWRGEGIAVCWAASGTMGTFSTLRAYLATTRSSCGFVCTLAFLVIGGAERSQTVHSARGPFLICVAPRPCGRGRRRGLNSWGGAMRFGQMAKRAPRLALAPTPAAGTNTRWA